LTDKIKPFYFSLIFTVIRILTLSLITILSNVIIMGLSLWLSL